jgi:hypothetical protein
MLRYEPLVISFDEIPEVARASAGPDSLPERRLLLARAVVPMSPVELITTLAYLTCDQSELVSKSAVATIENLPYGVLEEALKAVVSPSVLDVMARALPASRLGLHETVVQNRAADDETIAWISSRSEGNIIDIVARNQFRIQRCPKIVEAIYFNPHARMGVVLNLLEDAVRLGVDISAIPGYEEIVASIHGKDVAPPPPVILSPEDAQSEQPIELDPADLAAVEAAVAAAEAAEGASEEAAEPGEGIDDDTFERLLGNEPAAATSAESGKSDEGGPLGKSMSADLGKMSIPQKVRMALVGSETARRLLIKDSRRIVYMSVLKSPRLTDKEITEYAKNKALSEDVIRYIAANRDWTNQYSVKMALVANPKCPPIVAASFLRMMATKDVKFISKSHDVPGFVARAARQILGNREMGKRN